MAFIRLTTTEFAGEMMAEVVVLRMLVAVAFKRCSVHSY